MRGRGSFGQVAQAALEELLFREHRKRRRARPLQLGRNASDVQRATDHPPRRRRLLQLGDHRHAGASLLLERKAKPARRMSFGHALQCAHVGQALGRVHTLASCGNDVRKGD